MHLLGAKIRMRGGESHCAWLFFGANPDRAGASNQREGIVANDFGGAFQFELNGVVCEWPDGAKFIGHAQDHASRIGTIGVQMRVVREKSKFLVDAAAGKSFGNYLFTLQIAVNAQVSPVADGIPQIGYKRSITKMGKLGLVRIHLSHQLAGNIKFQVVAIRTDNGLGESD